MAQGIGIDISDHHVRIAYVNSHGVPIGLYELALTGGYVVDDHVEKPDGLKKQLQKLLAKTELRDVRDEAILLIPESRVFATSLEVKKDLSKEDRKAEALKRAQSEIPIPFKDAEVFVREGAKTAEGLRMSVASVQKTIINGFRTALVLPQFILTGIEANGKSLQRLCKTYGPKELSHMEEKDFFMIIDVGAHWTNITVYDKADAIVFSRSITIRSTMHKAGTGKALKLGVKEVERIASAVHNALAFFEESGYTVIGIAITGVEGAQIAIKKACEKAVKGHTVLRVGEMLQIPNVEGMDAHRYGAAIGAALRAAKPHPYRFDHNFLSL